jgi:NAD(P)-dependent dehydrogenase (short-subunit alcohol dehydrogenase family)
MQTLGQNYHALVIGSHGAIGRALLEAITADPNCALATGLSRATHAGFRLEDESSMAQAAESLAADAPFALIIDATGALTIDGRGPEKTLGALNAAQLQRSFEVNAIGPALLIKHFAPLLTKERSLYAKLSARVGSISDNSKGGWYGYRASKAALNMFLQTAAIEIQRKRPQAAVVALQPGTVASSLSSPFAGGHDVISPATSAQGLLQALDALEPKPGAQFFDYRGQPIAW